MTPDVDATEPVTAAAGPLSVEVEVVRLGLEQRVVGRSVTGVDVLHARPVRREPGGPEGFARALTGWSIGGQREPAAVHVTPRWDMAALPAV